MKKRNIVLTGFMAAGKTSVSAIIARKLKMDVIATDDIISRREEMSISDIFAKQGEEYFRGLERELVREISSKEGCIFDCGGGIILDERNIYDLKSRGKVFYLKASPELIYERAKLDDKRPLLKVKDPMAKIRELLLLREPLYSKADHTILVDDKTFEQVADEIIRIIKNG
ncbi:MAG: shikimate kinase [Candidatus Omnitrophica bacterium]|nr:shikimate kinase [Candidatus Omnitrophota bacterium]